LLNSNATRRRAPWREALRGLGYVVDGAFPREGALGADVLHRLVRRTLPPAASPRVPSGSAWAAGVAAFESAAAGAAAGARPGLRGPSGRRDARVAGAGEIDDPAVPPRRHRGRPRATTPRPETDRALARAAGAAFHAAMERWDFKDAGRLRTLLRSEAIR